MFAYCLNDPINYRDSLGHDAVWIQEETNVGTMGHSGLLVEDEETGRWYYFFWGAPESENGKAMPFGPGRVCFVIEVDATDCDFSKTEDVIKAVSKAIDNMEGLSDKEKAARKKITATVYFEGDYSPTYSHLTRLANLRNGLQDNYDLFVANCTQMSWKAMGASDERFGGSTVPSIIPNITYLFVLAFYFRYHKEFLPCEDLINASY